MRSILPTHDTGPHLSLIFFKALGPELCTANTPHPISGSLLDIGPKLPHGRKCLQVTVKDSDDLGIFKLWRSIRVGEK